MSESELLSQLVDRLLLTAQEHQAANPEPQQVTLSTGRPPKHDWQVTSVGCSAYCFVDHDLTRSRARVKPYGVAAVDLEILIENTGGLCMICRACHASIVDHCHCTGHVRGTVCLWCNQRIARIEPSRPRDPNHAANNCTCEQRLRSRTLENRVYAYLDHAMDFAHLTRRGAFAALARDPYPS